jgi:hypothetical protein
LTNFRYSADWSFPIDRVDLGGVVRRRRVRRDNGKSKVKDATSSKLGVRR